jgi:hypothetical protein
MASLVSPNIMGIRTRSKPFTVSLVDPGIGVEYGGEEEGGDGGEEEGDDGGEEEGGDDGEEESGDGGEEESDDGGEEEGGDGGEEEGGDGKGSEAGNGASTTTTKRVTNSTSDAPRLASTFARRNMSSTSVAFCTDDVRTSAVTTTLPGATLTL